MFTVSVSFFSCSVTQSPPSDTNWNNTLPRRSQACCRHSFPSVPTILLVKPSVSSVYLMRFSPDLCELDQWGCGNARLLIPGYIPPPSNKSFSDCSVGTLGSTLRQSQSDQAIRQKMPQPWLSIKWTWQQGFDCRLADWASSLRSHFNYLIIFRCQTFFFF